jgi:predicted SprT family Zn-dependent metalloprotease
VNNLPKDYTTRCRGCEGHLAATPLEFKDLSGTMYRCRQCGRYWLAMQTPEKTILTEMEVIAP